MDEKAEWLKGWLIREQEGVTKNPLCTQSEMEARIAMAEKFGISLNWAYEVIRKLVQQYPQFHLEKETVECGDNKGGLRKYKEWILTWIED
jgi:hypothetical protein